MVTRAPSQACPAASARNVVTHRNEPAGEEHHRRDAGRARPPPTTSSAAGVGERQRLVQQQVPARRGGPHGESAPARRAAARSRPRRRRPAERRRRRRAGVPCWAAIAAALAGSRPQTPTSSTVGMGGQRRALRDVRPVPGAEESEPHRSSQPTGRMLSHAACRLPAGASCRPGRRIRGLEVRAHVPGQGQPLAGADRGAVADQHLVERAPGPRGQVPQCRRRPAGPGPAARPRRTAPRARTSQRSSWAEPPGMVNDQRDHPVGRAAGPSPCARRCAAASARRRGPRPARARRPGAPVAPRPRSSAVVQAGGAGTRRRPAAPSARRRAAQAEAAPAGPGSRPW